MAQSEMASPPAITGSNERKIIFLLCCAAAIHVFIFSAAFPFFNLDEQAQFDLVVKFAHGAVPRGPELLSPESVPYLLLYDSTESGKSETNSIAGEFPEPLWQQPRETIHRYLAVKSPRWQRLVNYESAQPPLYYVVAGLWWHGGRWLGLEGGRLLYWLRFLNILLVAALVGLGYFAARTTFPENIFLRIGVPTLLAFLPQTAFYSIENDVLSPLCFGAAFICLVKFLHADKPGVGLGISTGLALAATFLTKMTNLPLLVLSAALVVFKMLRLAGTGKFRAASPALISLALCAGLPMEIWTAWCKSAFGDFTGSAAKIQMLGWTLKPFHQWWQHPIFTPGGVWTYLSGQLATFWQGEFMWHNQPLGSPAIDFVYTTISLLLLLMVSIRLFRRTTGVPLLQRQALGLALASVTAALAFFGFLSIIYDFHDCPNPSREHPYFHAGRMMLGALIPFLLLFVYGIDRALNRSSLRAKFLALAVMILFMLISEIVVDWPVFFSQYNWFHM